MTQENSLPPSSLGGAMRRHMQLEGAALLLASGVLYAKLDGDWGRFLLYFLMPDLAFVGYLAGARLGAYAYNTTHSMIGPLLLASVGFWLPQPLILTAALIWLAHIGFDRMLGYGLKYTAGFHYTHLGPIGRAAHRH